jgi:DNA-binding YbaB/EbfC family protein
MDPKQLQGMLEAAQKQAEQMQDQLKKTTVEASAGGGSVTVKMDGSKRVIAVKIDPEVVKSGDVEMLEDLVTAAVNEAGRKADEAMQGNMGEMLGGLNIPGLF